MKKILVLSLALALAGCGDAGSGAQAPAKVVTSGKTEVPISKLPQEVLAAAEAARPGFTPAEAEAETREGRRYFDIEGKLADGSEIEFDIMEENGRWRVVETQRDIAFAAAPQAIRDVAAKADAKFVPTRVIESTQADGVVIYELFGPAAGDPQGRKLEVKWDGKSAELLTKEWAH